MSKDLKVRSDLNVGDEVTATWAPNKLAPVQYHSFDVGPFSCTTTVREGESGEEAMLRAYNVCVKVARDTYAQKRDEFLENVKDSAQAARESTRR